MICETCGKEFFEDWRKDKRTPCRFCCKKCSNTRKPSEASLRKIASSLKVFYEKKAKEPQTCIECGSVFFTKDLSRKKCFNCLPNNVKKAHIEKEPKSILDMSRKTSMKIAGKMKLPCTCCGFYVEGVVWDFHHIIPRSKGGSDKMDNITYICPNCHRIAHTDISLLVNPLRSLKDVIGDDWKNYYNGAEKDMGS